MNFLLSLIREKERLGPLIDQMVRPAVCSRSTWTPLDGYIESNVSIISDEEFSSIFPSKSLSFSGYPSCIPLSEQNKQLSGRWKAQPFGSQRPPDFIGFEAVRDQLYIFYVECKSSKTNKATWNCSLPIPLLHVIYPFFNTTSKQLSICTGADLITSVDYEALKAVMPLIREKNTIGHLSSDWNLYLRPMWCTSRVHPDNTVLLCQYLEGLVKM